MRTWIWSMYGTCTANIATWCFLCSDFVGGCRMSTKSRSFSRWSWRIFTKHSGSTVFFWSQREILSLLSSKTKQQNLVGGWGDDPIWLAHHFFKLGKLCVNKNSRLERMSKQSSCCWFISPSLQVFGVEKSRNPGLDTWHLAGQFNQPKPQNQHGRGRSYGGTVCLRCGWTMESLGGLC